MFPAPENFYAAWRARLAPAPALRKEADPPPERLLLAFWQHQRLRREQLATTDGRIGRPSRCAVHQARIETKLEEGQSHPFIRNLAEYGLFIQNKTP